MCGNFPQELFTWAKSPNATRVGRKIIIGEIFMKILGRKLTAIALLSVFMVSAFALSVVSFAYKPAKAQQQINLPDNIVYKNIEDCVYDITAATTAGGIQYANGLEQRDLGYVTKEDVIISDTLGQDKINIEPTRYAGDSSLFGFYTKKGSECQPDYNGNQYEGNIYVWNKSTSQAKYAQNQILFYAGADDTFVTFRMRYTTGNLYQFNEDVPNLGSWNYYHRYAINTDGSVAISADNANVASHTTSALLADLQAREESATALYETGDMLLITIGSFHTGTEATNYYFKVVNETKGYVAYELLEQGDYVPATAGYFVIYWQGIARAETRFNLCGVNKPLFANYDYAIEDKVSGGLIGKNVSELQLREGYSHLDGTQEVIKVGVNKVKVNYNLNYFGKDSKIPATVTFSVEASKVTLKDMAGNVIAEQDVVGELELPVIDREKTFIAYKTADGKLYKQGDVITISGDVVVTLIEADVEFIDKVDIRLSNDEFGGLRYGVKVLTAEFNALQQAGISFTTKIDGVEVAIATTVEEGEYTIVYIAKKDIASEKFNTNISAEVVVEYESGESAIASKDANLYELASARYDENLIAMFSGKALYNATAVSLLEKYLKA